MPASDRILPLEAIAPWRERQRVAGRRVVATNGCFDLLHAGHVRFLEAARALGDVLLVGVNSDESVRSLKGPGRPANLEADRALLIASLASVDAVTVFPETRATRFLSLATPEVWAKGGDYCRDTLIPEEVDVVERAGGLVALLPLVPGHSTTGLLQRLRDAGSGRQD